VPARPKKSISPDDWFRPYYTQGDVHFLERTVLANVPLAQATTPMKAQGKTAQGTPRSYSPKPAKKKAAKKAPQKKKK
jgi:hypothetical protein